MVQRHVFPEAIAARLRAGHRASDKAKSKAINGRNKPSRGKRKLRRIAIKMQFRAFRRAAISGLRRPALPPRE
jgi:hypothetical protein